MCAKCRAYASCNPFVFGILPTCKVQRQEPHLRSREMKLKFQDLTPFCLTAALALSTVPCSPLDGATWASSKDLPPVSYQVRDAPVLNEELLPGNGQGRFSARACPCRQVPSVHPPARLRGHACGQAAPRWPSWLKGIAGCGAQWPFQHCEF